MSLKLNDPSMLKSSVYIDGQWVASGDNTTFNIANPATAETIGTLLSCSTSETHRAINAASEALEYGVVDINEGAISNEMAPFGDIKESGQAREGSKYGLDDYLEIKYLGMGGIDS